MSSEPQIPETVFQAFRDKFEKEDIEVLFDDYKKSLSDHPTINLELVAVVPSGDGNACGGQNLWYSWQARVSVPEAVGGLQAFSIAETVAHYVNENSFEIAGAYDCQIPEMSKDVSFEELADFRSWLVEWRQMVIRGDFLPAREL